MYAGEKGSENEKARKRTRILYIAESKWGAMQRNIVYIYKYSK